MGLVHMAFDNCNISVLNCAVKYICLISPVLMEECR
jgi:hypothetical protein